MPRPPPATLARRLAVVVGGVLLAACQGVEGPSLRGDSEPTTASRPTSFWRDAVRNQSIEPRVYPSEAPHRWQWIVETGTASGGVGGSLSSPLAGGLAVAVRSDAPARTVETVSVEDGTPAALRVGTLVWPRGPDDPSGIPPGTEVVVDWLVCLRERGTCAVDVDAVPRVLGRGACPTPFEAWRVRRTVPIGSALVIGTAEGRPTSPAAAALVGAADGRPGRLILLVK